MTNSRSSFSYLIRERVRVKAR
ncbi:Protein of unknown function, partial [Cotesia congregata]